MFDENGYYIDDLGDIAKDQTSINQAEELFGFDINGDGVQGRNLEEFDTFAYVSSKGITTFPGGSNNKTLITDLNSGEILFASSLPGDSDNQTLLRNQDGTRFIAGDSFTAFDIEEASDGTIQLLSYVCLLYTSPSPRDS